jgi:putative oxidoreductase
MNTLHKIEIWADAHHPFWIDFIRMGLGLFLVMKGIFFIQNTDALLALIKSPDHALWAAFIAHYVAFAHLVGGLIIAIGLMTRMSILFQLPILIGAVFYINLSRGVYDSELWESLVVLVLLLAFLVFGSGRISVDRLVGKGD